MALTPTIEIEIGELVLHGFDRRDAAAVTGAFRSELARAFADASSMPAADVAVPSLRASSPRPLQTDRPAAAGTAAARALAGGLPR